MSKTPKFSIIICLYRISDRFYDDLAQYKSLTYKDFEIILATEKNAQLDNEKLNKLGLPIRIVKSSEKKISLGKKRDLGFKNAKGEFIAYIDDDAYPEKDWLTNSLYTLHKDSKIGALGGPNITPPDDSFWAKIGGHIYESYLTSAGAQYRFVPKKKGEVREIQGVNMFIPRKILEELGGFNFDLNSGDDDKICMDLRKKGYKIMYDPQVLVYHHRREFPLSHLKQVKGMGTHRGFFLKIFPETFGPIYFFPLIMVVGSFFLISMSFFIPELRLALLILFLIYFFLCYISSMKRTGILPSLIVAIGIILTHFTYGIFFIKGLLVKKIY